MKGYWGEQFADSIGNRWKPILVISIICAIAGAGLSALAPKHWPARALIQIGEAGNGTPLIDPAAVVQRITFPSFATDVISALGLPADGDRRSDLIRRTLSASIPRGSNLVELRVDGTTPQEAKNIASTALSLLQKEHQALLAPSVERKEKLLSDYQTELKNLADQRTSILTRLTSASAKAGSSFSENIVLSGIVQADSQQTRLLNEQVASLQEQLDPTKTFNTKAVAPVYVPSGPTSLSRLSGAGFGFLAGMILAIAWFSITETKFRISFYSALIGKAGKS